MLNFVVDGTLRRFKDHRMLPQNFGNKKRVGGDHAKRKQ